MTLGFEIKDPPVLLDEEIPEDRRFTVKDCSKSFPSASLYWMIRGTEVVPGAVNVRSKLEKSSGSSDPMMYTGLGSMGWAGLPTVTTIDFASVRPALVTSAESV
jgi:hypothetical protein